MNSDIERIIKYKKKFKIAKEMDTRYWCWIEGINYFINFGKYPNCDLYTYEGKVIIINKEEQEIIYKLFFWKIKISRISNSIIEFLKNIKDKICLQ